MKLFSVTYMDHEDMVLFHVIIKAESKLDAYMKVQPALSYFELDIQYAQIEVNEVVCSDNIR